MNLPPGKYYSKEKDYSKHPELLDLHVKRLIAANAVVGSYMEDSDLLRSGLMRFDRFLGYRPWVAAISKEIFRSAVGDWKRDETLVSNRPDIAAYAAVEKMWDLVAGVFKPPLFNEVTNFFIKNTYLQHLVNKPHDGDDQKVFHSDTFFHCLKFWYFPERVSADDGAFWYVPNSPIVTDKLLDWHRSRVEDLKSGRVEEWRGRGHLEGSFRISTEEIKALGLEPIPVEAKADTLILANVFGFHKRGDTKQPTHRLSIHGSIRISDPFAYQGAATK